MNIRDADLDGIPLYFTSVNGHRCLLSVPGRPPICFRCEEVGQLRLQCNGWSMPQSRTRSYATGVQTPAAGKRTEGPGGKAPTLQAVGKPSEGPTVFGKWRGQTYGTWHLRQVAQSMTSMVRK